MYINEYICNITIRFYNCSLLSLVYNCCVAAVTAAKLLQSCPTLCDPPELAAHQAPPSLGFSRQEHWSGLPFPSSMHESEKWKWSHSVMSNFSNPMDCSLPGFSVNGIFQARVLEWGAITSSQNCCVSDTLISILFFLKNFLLNIIGSFSTGKEK